MTAATLLKRFSVADFEAMIARGVLGEDDHVELLDGYVTQMNAKGPFHDWVQHALMSALLTPMVRQDLDLHVSVERMCELGPRTELQPDLVVHTPLESPRRVKPADILLILEVSDSSLAFDLSEKAMAYADSGVPEYWVVDIRAEEMVVHTKPTATGYAHVVRFGADEELIIPGAPGVSLRLRTCL